MQSAHDVELQEGRSNARRRRDDALELTDAKDHRQYRDDQDADQDRAANLQRIEHGDHEEAEDGEQRSGLLEIAEAHERCRIVNDDAGVLQGDDAEEEADTGGNRASQ
ncbi:hypothetical protein D9M70_468860 [compost metagenome]